MTGKQREEAKQTTDENPDIITVVDQNGITVSKKIEQIENTNVNTNNNNEVT